MTDPERRLLPAWLVGLLIAVVVFVVFLAVSSWLGVGDDPGVEGASSIPLTLSDQSR